MGVRRRSRASKVGVSLIRSMNFGIMDEEMNSVESDADADMKSELFFVVDCFFLFSITYLS
jgi:hypothetical protein